MPDQLSLLDPLAGRAKPLSRSQSEVYEALGRWPGAADTTDLQRILAEHDIHRERSNIAKRLNEMEALSLVQRVGRNFDRPGHPTTWRRVA